MITYLDMYHYKTTKVNALKIIRISIFCCILLCVNIACDDKPGNNTRSPEQLAQFIRFNDSIIRPDTNAPALCDSMMSIAADSLTYYDYYILKGRYYLLSDKPDSALDIARRTRTFAKRQAPTPRTLGLEALANSTEAGFYHLLRRDTPKSIKLNTTAYEQILESDLKYYSPEMAANLADAYIAADDLPNGAKWYRRALLLVDSLNLPEAKSTTLYMGLGQIYTTMEDFSNARYYYEKTEEHFRLMKPNMQSYFLNNYGNYYYFKHDYNNALKIFRRLQTHLRKTNAESTYDMYLCSINMADIFLNLGMTDSAETYVNKVFGYFEANKVAAGIYYANTIRIGIALKRQDYADITQILDSEKSPAPYVQAIKNIRSKYLQEYYVQTGNYKKAYENLLSNLQQNDSMEHNRTHMRSAEIMMRFDEDTLKLHHQLALNEKDAQVNKSRAAITIALSIMLTMAFIIAYGIIYLRKRRIQTKMEVLTLKLYNTRQRISPHFVFNVLNAQIGSASDKDAGILLSLARLIRANLEMTAKAYITLNDELNFIKEYVGLERILIGKDFCVNIIAPDTATLKEVRIPAMMIQILVENSIKHGIKNIDGPKRLDITADCSTPVTIVTVADNGHGIDITKMDDTGKKNGLSIITHTIAIINQENYGANKMTFNIGNTYDAEGNVTGCKAILTIPRTVKYI